MNTNKNITKPLKKVLIIEKDDLLVNLIKSYVKRLGSLYIDTFIEENDITNTVNMTKYDLIVADWKNKSFGGENLYLYIRRSNTNYDTPLLLVAGSLTPQELVKIRGDKYTRFVLKPFSADVFFDILKIYVFSYTFCI